LARDGPRPLNRLTLVKRNGASAVLRPLLGTPRKDNGAATVRAIYIGQTSETDNAPATGRGLYTGTKAETANGARDVRGLT